MHFFLRAAHKVPPAGGKSAPVSRSSVADAFYWALWMTLYAIKKGGLAKLLLASCHLPKYVVVVDRLWA